MQIRSVGIDLGKTTFHLVALGTAGKDHKPKSPHKHLDLQIRVCLVGTSHGALTMS